VLALHEDTGAVLARVWKLPDELATVISLHHRLKDGGKIHPMAASIILAHSFAEDVGASLVAPPPCEPNSGEVDDPAAVQSAIAALGFQDRLLGAVRADAKNVADRITWSLAAG
jgi:hypothetical protein